MCKWHLLIMGSIPFILASCSDSGMMKENKDLDDIYATYVISGEEGNDFVTAVVQLHSGRTGGPGIFLKEPSKLLLDDKPMPADSARESGVFYELQSPVDEFVGKHVVRFIDADKKEYREEFEFTPLKLAEEVPEAAVRQSFVLTFKDLPKKQPVRVVMTDTAMDGEGVNEVDTIINNRLDLSRHFTSLTNGPIMLQLFSEQERWLKSYKGEISVTYALKREFELKD